MKKDVAFLLFTFIFLIALLNVACNDPAGKESKTHYAKGDSLKFVVFESAPEFLPSWKKDNAVIYHVLTDPDDMHPTNGTNSIRSEINLYTQMALVSTDYRTLSIHPSLIKKMPELSADFLSYTCELRDEPKWDNGDSLELKDILFTVKANICQLTNNPFVKPYWENMKDIIPDPVNKRKFTVVMKKTYVQNIAFWTDFPILQQKYFDPEDIFSKYTMLQMNDPAFKAENHAELVKWASNFNDSKYGHDPAFMTGLGMYRISEWVPGQYITLVKKKNHWTESSSYYGEKSLPEAIIFKVVKDANAQELEFKSQSLDATGSISTKVLVSLQSDKTFNANYNSGFIDTYNYSYVALNERPDGIRHKKLFTDVKVRKALAMLTPVDQLIKMVHKGKNKRMLGPVSFLKTEFNENLKPVPLDIEAAKSLLDEAGWKDSDGDNIRDKVVDGIKIPLEFKLNYYTTQVEWKDIASIMAESMYKAGVKADLNPLDVGNLVLAARQHDFDMMLGSWASSMLPEDFTQLWHTSSWSSEGSNYTGFGNAASDALIDSIKFTLDDNARMDMVKRFQEMVYNDQPYIFLFASLRRVVVHKRFAGGEMYFEKPGLLLNNLRLLGPGAMHANSATQ
jgi:peptide/nickel transport system substrate-binding protein